ncbi:hypothetical protein Tco_0180459, partial [Tanacetum coccineum]
MYLCFSNDTFSSRSQNLVLLIHKCNALGCSTFRCVLRFEGVTTSRQSVSKTDERIDKLADQLSTLVEIVSTKVVTPAPVKEVEETCVTCGGAHSWYNCPTTDNNQASICATTGTYNQVAPPNRVSNQMAPPGFAPMQNNGQN